MNLTVLGSIFRRDFVNYFSNATGYVFICVFVILSSVATFFPEEFFGNNLANLDQLSKWMPLILLVFVPAITMGIWAEERRRGTDELLLTLPATDFDVVIGKYLAAVAIFTVSLAFASLSILLIFQYGLGYPDPLLFACTFLGYWLVGLAMLATGMVASFLTGNLTVAFILAVLLNLPQAFASQVSGAIGLVFSGAAAGGGSIVAEFLAGSLQAFNAFEGFAGFARGVVSLSGVLHFACIVALMLYVSMVLIGKRHWAGGEDGESLFYHYLVRTVALFVVVGGVNTVLGRYDTLRIDMTSDGANSLSPQTVRLVRGLRGQDDLPPVRIAAYVSPTMPSEYAGQKRELLSVIEALRSISGGKVVASVTELETFSEQADLAERTYGIEPRAVTTRVRGKLEEEQIFLGVAVSCGLDKVVIPFLDKGIPAEYELVRSITTVSDDERKRVGVVKTDAPLFSGFSMQGERPESRLITELKKQYDVVEVDATSPITGRYDVLLAVQPSGLAPAAFENFLAAVEGGQATAIFEDPLPVTWPGVVGTDERKPPAGGMMGMFGGGPPPPKGDINKLWRLLGARMDAADIVWQDYNPYDNLPQGTPDWVFIDTDTTPNAFSQESEITRGVKQVLFLVAGGLKPTPGAKTDFTPLAVTSDRSGTTPTSTVQGYFRQMVSPDALERSRRVIPDSYILAARVQGQAQRVEELNLDDQIEDGELRGDAAAAEAEADDDEPGANDDRGDGGGDQQEPVLDVVLVADIDVLGNVFFDIRAIGKDDELDTDYRWQNVAFVLNILDELAGDQRFLAVRTRTRDDNTLQVIEQATAKNRAETQKQIGELKQELQLESDKARQRFQDAVAAIRNDDSLAADVKRVRLERVELTEQRKLDVTINGLEQEAERKIRATERELQGYIAGVQNRYKALAVVIPPIPPLLLGLWVYFRRRTLEKEGVSKERLRYSKRSPTQPRQPVGAA